MLMSLGLAAAALLGGPQDDSRKAVEDFKAKVKDAKTLQEKALAIRALGDADPRDGAAAAAIARYLLPGGNDPCCLLPATAADALAKFRGNGAASKALVAALPAYRK